MSDEADAAADSSIVEAGVREAQAEEDSDASTERRAEASVLDGNVLDRSATGHDASNVVDSETGGEASDDDGNGPNPIGLCVRLTDPAHNIQLQFLSQDRKSVV